MTPSTTSMMPSSIRTILVPAPASMISTFSFRAPKIPVPVAWSPPTPGLSSHEPPPSAVA
jgi:hypothetical protein